MGKKQKKQCETPQLINQIYLTSMLLLAHLFTIVLSLKVYHRKTLLIIIKAMGVIVSLQRWLDLGAAKKVNSGYLKYFHQASHLIKKLVLNIKCYIDFTRKKLIKTQNHKFLRIFIELFQEIIIFKTKIHQVAQL